MILSRLVFRHRSRDHSKYADALETVARRAKAARKERTAPKKMEIDATAGTAKRAGASRARTKMKRAEIVEARRSVDKDKKMAEAT